MDLGAYTQIDVLEQIAKNNGIDIPRLRGYRLMKDEQPISKEEIAEMMKRCEIDIAKDLCCSDPFWDPNSCCSEWSGWTDLLQDYYLIKSEEPNEYGRYPYVGIHWDRIHGWNDVFLNLKSRNKNVAFSSSMIFGINMLVERMCYIFTLEWVVIIGSIGITIKK